MHHRILGALILCTLPAAAQTSAPKPTPNKPNLTGLWQAFGAADWDIQAHGAEAGPFYQLGAIGAVPPGASIVVGDEIPYLPKALEQKKKISQIATSSIRSSSATCRVCRGPTIWRSPSRSFSRTKTS